jgi:hypothetical protein
MPIITENLRVRSIHGEPTGTVHGEPTGTMPIITENLRVRSIHGEPTGTVHGEPTGTMPIITENLRVRSIHGEPTGTVHATTPSSEGAARPCHHKRARQGRPRLASTLRHLRLHLTGCLPQSPLKRARNYLCPHVRGPKRACSVRERISLLRINDIDHAASATVQ